MSLKEHVTKNAFEVFAPPIIFLIFGIYLQWEWQVILTFAVVWWVVGLVFFLISRKQ